MLEDPDKGIVYIPVTKDFMAQREWSGPVQFKFERNDRGEIELVLRSLETKTQKVLLAS